MRRNHKRGAAVLSAAAILATGVPAGAGSPAYAVGPDVTCVGSETAHLTPGMVVEPRPNRVRITGRFATCESSDPDVTYGSYRESFTKESSCASVVDPGDGVRTFRWSDGSTSTFSYHRTVNVLPGVSVVTFTGSITKGKFKGGTAVETVALVAPDPVDCAGDGVRKFGGVAILEILQPL